MCLSWSIARLTQLQRQRVAYGMSLSKPTLPLAGANRVQQCLNKLKVRTGWLAGIEGEDSRICRGTGLCEFACLCVCVVCVLNHSLHSISEGLSPVPWCLGSEACFKSWAVFDRGDLFSVGLYMVAPWLAEGPCAMWQISAKDRTRERASEILGGILGSETPRSISNQDNCHVPLFCSAASYSNSSESHSSWKTQLYLNSVNSGNRNLN